MKRKIITIDEEKCNGCGDCIPGCPEGALQIVDGKAKLVRDSFCDGLGACLGRCPLGAITVEERDAEDYNERQVLENIQKQGKEVLAQHLHHLEEHGETELLAEARAILKEKENKKEEKMTHEHHGHAPGGCPGSRSMQFGQQGAAPANGTTDVPSQLTHWPIQLHLVSPQSPAYQNADVLLAADCVPFAMGNFHQKFLKGKALCIACPKLDDGMDIYAQKLTAMVEMANINTLTVMIMQVPCCMGLLQLAKQAVEQAKRKVPIKALIVSLQGEILREDWV